jgi:formate hydrogenlyase subunit 6/NADH:ubiquinone oxidoreductase subunit I
MEGFVMRYSVFSQIGFYFRDVFRGAWSILGSCMTAFPYLFRWGDLRKEVTEGYPDPVSSKTADDLPPRSRGLLFNDIDRCTGCRACEKVCPSKCIRVEEEPGAEASKIWVSVFDIDFGQCIFCGLCVDVCQPNSLVHTRQYEGAAYSLNDLVASFGRGQVTPEQRAKWAAIRQMSENDEVML